MKKCISLITATMLAIILFRCDSDNKIISNDKTMVIGSGPIVLKTVDPPAFQSIVNIAMTRVSVTKGSPQKVVLKAQQNVLDVLRCEVEAGKLTLDFGENINVKTSEEIEADITVAAISDINSIGVGNFTMTGAKQSRIIFNLTGTGNVDAYALPVDTCTITITGTGNCRIRVNELLVVTLTGTGNVYYKGNPSIISSVTGTGRIINDN
ncbi:MAG: DUF2807 domain-containing protein [Calditrichia bacterium]